MKKKKVIIKCTEKQALLIEIALDTLSRLTAGQLGELKRGIECFKGQWIDVDWEEYDKVLYKLKKHLFPELHENAYYGVGMKELGDGQIAYEMVKKLQNFRVRNKVEDCGVLRHEPLHYSKEPLIEVIEDDK